MNRRDVLLAGAAASLVAAGAKALPSSQRKILLIGHRGAPAFRPEHTLASYAKAVEDGADYIEPDLCMTKDGALIVRHENNIAETTDIATHPEFAGRKTEKVIDGMKQVGWFTEDFTLAELKTLRARERLPKLRAANAAMDGWFDLMTFEEVVDYAAGESLARGRPIGVAPEMKHPSYFASIGLPIEDRTIAVLQAHHQTMTGPVILQCFEPGPLQYVRRKMGRPGNLQLMQLCAKVDPALLARLGKSMLPLVRQLAELTGPEGIIKAAGYADILAPELRTAIPLRADKSLGEPAALIDQAHKAGMKVVVWTFRPENQFLAHDFWSGSDPNYRNPSGSIAEMRAYIAAGIDGFFTDDPALGRTAIGQGST